MEPIQQTPEPDLTKFFGWITVLSAAGWLYSQRSYSNYWENVIPDCTRRGGDLLGSCYNLVESASTVQTWGNIAMWVAIISGGITVLVFFGSKNEI